MAPCCRLYGFIGLALAAAYPDVQHAYTDWIATYSSAPYMSVPDMQEALMNEIGDEGKYGACSRLPEASTSVPVRKVVKAVRGGQPGFCPKCAVSERGVGARLLRLYLIDCEFAS